jgi:N-acetylmuramoyl-L-alanine amidase
MQPKTLFVDSGHGYAQGSNTVLDNGATANGLTERQFTVAIGQKLRTALQADPVFAGVQIVGDAVDERLNIEDHIAEVNNLTAQDGLDETNCILVSLHVNSGDGEGVEVWYPMRGGPAIGLAMFLAKSVVASAGFVLRNPAVLPSNQNRLGRLGILDDTKVLSCLVEMGFIQSTQDDTILQTKQDQIVSGIINGLKEYLNVPISPQSLFPDVPQNTETRTAVENLHTAGIVNGYPDGTFRPDQPITRGEVAIMMDRQMKAKN